MAAESKPAQPGPSTAGFTLIEVIAALLIGWITMAAFFHTFAFGTAQVEQQGRRRQALALLDGELEYWRARFQAADAANPVHPGEAEARRRAVTVDPAEALAFQVDPELSPLLRDRDLRFQEVKVMVSWQSAGTADTLALESRMYVR